MNIIYENAGDHVKIPGIPYDSWFDLVHVFITKEVPTPMNLEYLLSLSNDKVQVTPWSLDVVRGFKDYVPTTFGMITKDMSAEMMSHYFNLPVHWKPEPERVLLQLQSELDAKSATIDAAIIHNRKDYGGIVNKVHTINRIYNIGRIHNFFADRSNEYPFLFGSKFEEREQWDEMYINIKKMFMQYLEEVPLGGRWYAMKMRTQEVSNTELQETYVYVDWLKQKLGDDIKGILLYGSAARSSDPKEYSDFDNWVRVRDVEKAQRALRNTCPAVLDGKVVELTDGQHPEGAKHLGIHFFPESDNYMLRFIRFLHDSREFLKHTKVLYGEIPFIKVRQDEVIERGISHAYIKLKTIAGALNWAYTYPDKMLGKPALFEFVVKNVRFFFQHMLNAVEGPKLRTKAELNARLLERGLHIPEYRENPNYIREAILFSMYSVLKLQSEYYRRQQEPDLAFIPEKREYGWDDPEIDLVRGTLKGADLEYSTFEQLSL